MPTLNWIGKDAVVRHHKDVPFRLLEPVPELLLLSPSGTGAGGNVLTGPVLDALPEFAGPKVIYAAACRLGAARVRRDGITFKQTTYALDL